MPINSNSSTHICICTGPISPVWPAGRTTATITAAATMAMVPDTMSTAKRPAAKSRRRLIPFAASAPRRAPPRSSNGSPPGGDNVRATRASTFDMSHQPFDDWAPMGPLARTAYSAAAAAPVTLFSTEAAAAVCSAIQW